MVLIQMTLENVEDSPRPVDRGGMRESQLFNDGEELTRNINQNQKSDV